MFHFIRGELPTAQKLGERCLKLAQRVHDPTFLLAAHSLLGMVSFYLGQFTAACAHLEYVIARCNPQQHRFMAARYGNDPGVTALSFLAMVLIPLGYLDQALEKTHEALTLAEQVAHPFSKSLALGAITTYHQFLHDGRATQERAEAEMALAREQKFPLWLARGTMLRGWALAKQGQGVAGIAQIRQGLADWRATGAKAAQPYFLALLAEAYEQIGQTEAGLTVLAEALAATRNTGERGYEAELYRLKGELRLRSRQVEDKSRTSHRQVEDNSEVASPQLPALSPQAEAEAEACFHKAIDIARRQGAKSFELRAVMSLGLLWQRQGKKDEARQMLAEVYGWFTEGFDTTDLKAAKALLEELM